MTILIWFFIFQFQSKKIIIIIGFYKLSFRFFYFNSIASISTQIPRILTPFPTFPAFPARFPAFLPLFPAFLSFRSPILHFGFYR